MLKPKFLLFISTMAILENTSSGGTERQRGAELEEATERSVNSFI